MKKHLIIAALLLLSLRSLACSCDPAYASRGFCQVIAECYNRPMFCVVKLELLSFHHWGVYAKVLDNIYNTANADTIIIWGDNGALCRPGLATTFYTGDILIMALEQTDLAGNFMNLSLPDYETPDDYVLPGCGVYTLYYQNGMVVGSFNNGTAFDFIPYNDFVAAVQNCISSADVKTISAPKFCLSPNPAASVVHISTSEKIHRIEILNSLGQCVLSAHPALKDFNINIEALPAGVYTIVLFADAGRQVFHQKLIKQ